MLPAITYAAAHTSCPDYHVAAGGKPAWWDCEGEEIVESGEDWDTASKPVLIKSTSAPAIRSLFPRGAPHPQYPNLRLQSRGPLVYRHGGYTQVQLRYKGLCVESPSNAAVPQNILAMRRVDQGQNREMNFTSGFSGLPGFPTATNGYRTRLSEIQSSYSILFVSSTRFNPPHVANLPDATLVGAPTAPAFPYTWLSSITRVYPNGWVLKSWESQEAGDIWLIRWDFVYEHAYQPG